MIMTTEHPIRRKRNPNVQRALRPFFIFFFLGGLDLIHDSINELPLFGRIYLKVTHAVIFIERLVSIVLGVITLTESTMDLGLASVVTSDLVAILNAFASHAMYTFKWTQVKRMINELHDVSTDIIDDNSIFHKKVLWIQRGCLVVIFGTAILTAISKPQRHGIDSGIVNNASSSYFGYISRSSYMASIYWFVENSCLVSHLVCVCFFSVLLSYIQVNFECLKQKSLNDIRELKDRSSSLSPRVIRTADKVTVWDTNSTGLKHRRRVQGSQHPVWVLLRRHQELTHLVTLMDKTFREVIIIWSFSELTLITFMIRALKGGVTQNDHYIELLWLILIFSVSFVSKCLRAGIINDQVG